MNDTNTLQPYRFLPAFCVGNHTANAAREGGFSTIHISDGGVAELVELIAKSHINGPIYYPCAVHPAADLAAALAPHGVMTIKNPVYEMRAATQMPPVLEAACVSGRLTAIAFYSRRTADIFAQLGAPILDKPVRLSFTALCLSENVAQPMLKNHFTRIALPDYPSEEAMLSCARDILHGLRS